MDKINKKYVCTRCANYINGECDYPQCMYYELTTVVNCFKPKKSKKIDLSNLIGSNIDMEFVDDNFENETIKISTLSNINNTGTAFKYITKDCISYKKCRIRQDHWMVWGGGVCPLPNGLRGVMRLRNKKLLGIIESGRLNWEYGLVNSESDVIAFKVTGTLDDWKYLE